MGARREWSFYGRGSELDHIRTILARGRWFFAQISGRRRIGKTTLIREALAGTRDRVFYVQVPDSAPAGVLSAVNDAFDTFAVPAAVSSRPRSLREVAAAIGAMARAGYIVVVDEFQYFHRAALAEFPSHLQDVVDALSAKGARVPGGLFVLGSVHTEMEALLSDRRAPLFDRTTDNIAVQHLDIASVLTILRAHSEASPERLLFLWNLFEGVPKFYRDAYEQDVLDRPRIELLAKLFFRSSAPLRNEADTWFLGELRGRYETVLRYVARHPGCSHGELVAHVQELNPGSNDQVGGYLKILIERYQMIARRQPIFARRTERSGRYYVEDNFLRCWLDALSKTVVASHFRPEAELVMQADRALTDSEGHGLEKLVATIYEERSRRALSGFSLTARIQGYWDSAHTELDLVAVDDQRETIRFATCRRAPHRLLESLAVTEAHVARFLAAHRKYQGWRKEHVAIAPVIDRALRAEIVSRRWIAEDLADLTAGL